MRNTGRAGFSIVELLVSMAILSILLVALLGMLSALTTAWQAGEAHNERRTVAQAVLERMSRELSEAALPTSRTNTNSLQLVINPSGIGTAYQNSQAIFWNAPVSTDSITNSSGNMALVGYFVQWVNGTASTPGTPCMSRLLINPSSTDYSSTAASTWLNASLLSKYAPSTYVSSTATNNYQGLMAENVLGLWVQANDYNGVSISQGVSSTPGGEAFDSRYSYSFTNSAGNTVTNIACAMPSSVQIAIVVIDSRTAKQLPGTGKPTYPPLSGNIVNDVQTFYNNLPNPLRKGAEIQMTTVPLAGAPR
jgi:prepilin-type N-terminal cleavage/methylation domain-containing protein